MKKKKNTQDGYVSPPKTQREKKQERIDFLIEMKISRTQILLQSLFLDFSFIFILIGSIFAVLIPLRPDLFYQHHFIPDYVGFKKPAQVLTIDSPERRLMVQDAITKNYLQNEFNLNPLTNEGLYLRQGKRGTLGLFTTIREKEINKMALVAMNPPLAHSTPLFEKDAMAYYGPRALQKINSQSMLDSLSRYSKMLYRDELELGGYISMNSDGTFAPYTEAELPLYFSQVLPIGEGRPYLNAQVDINNPNADALLAERTWTVQEKPEAIAEKPPQS